jgi:hypothetical protein
MEVVCGKNEKPHTFGAQKKCTLDGWVGGLSRWRWLFHSEQHKACHMQPKKTILGFTKKDLRLKNKICCEIS